MPHKVTTLGASRLSLQYTEKLGLYANFFELLFSDFSLLVLMKGRRVLPQSLAYINFIFMHLSEKKKKG